VAVKVATVESETAEQEITELETADEKTGDCSNKRAKLDNETVKSTEAKLLSS
jgi:hypothetical protein